MPAAVWRGVSWAALLVAVLVFASVDRRPPEWMAPDAPSYAQLAENLAAGDGYRVDIPGEPEGSRYPPGFPMLIAPLTWVMDVQYAAVLLAVACVVAVWWTARRLGGDVAAAVAVTLVALSPAFRDAARDVMSDLSATAITVLAVAAYASGRQRLAGALAGFAAWVRVAQMVAIVGLRRRGLAVALGFAAALALTKLAWGWGYRDGHAEWSLRHIVSVDGVVVERGQQPALPNFVAIPAVLLGWGGLIAPGAFFAATATMWRRPERRFVLAVIGGAVAVYLPYFYQLERFLLPAAAVIAIYAGAWVAERLPEPAGTESNRVLVTRHLAQSRRALADVAPLPQSQRWSPRRTGSKR